MTATNHVLTGAIIAATVHNPALAIPLAFVSHFILDGLPHFGVKEHTNTAFLVMLGSDAVLAALLLLTFAVFQPEYWQLMVVCGIVAASPDLMWLPPWIDEMRHKKPKKPHAFARFHSKIQWCERSWGWTTELLWFLVGLPILIHVV